MNIIKEMLVKKTLDEFYDTYKKIGEGYIINHKGGEAIYEEIEAKFGKIEAPDDVKKTIIYNCKKAYHIFYSQYNHYSDADKAKLFKMYCKSSLVEWYLNSLLKKDGTGQIITFD